MNTKVGCGISHERFKKKQKEPYDSGCPVEIVTACLQNGDDTQCHLR
jgi:hypothetical protein